MRKILFILILFSFSVKGQVVTDTILTDETSGFFLFTSNSWDSVLVTSKAPIDSIPQTDLGYWFKANATDTITKDGSDYVRRWGNYAPSGLYPLIQYTGSAQPLYVADGGSGVNNKSVIRFSSGDFLKSLLGSTINQPSTFIIVFKTNSLTAFINIDGYDCSNRNTLYYNGTNLNLFAGILVGYAYSNTTTFVTSTFLLDDTNCNIWENGTFKAGGSGGTQGTNGLTVGIGCDDAFGPFNGDIAEIIVYNTDISVESGNGDITAVELYLQTKYGHY